MKKVLIVFLLLALLVIAKVYPQPVLKPIPDPAQLLDRVRTDSVATCNFSL
jgi:hypothetical protein